MAKSLFVMVIDHDTFKQEHPDGKELSREELVSIGKVLNDQEAGWLGYEAWMILHDVPQRILSELDGRNIPAEPLP